MSTEPNRKGALQAFSLHGSRLSEVQKVMVDGGSTGQAFADGVKRLLNADVEVAKRSELHTFAVIPKRWVVERSFAWLEKCRRLWKNCENLINTSLQMVVPAFLTLLLKRLQASLSNPARTASPHQSGLGTVRSKKLK